MLLWDCKREALRGLGVNTEGKFATVQLTNYDAQIIVTTKSCVNYITAINCDGVLDSFGGIHAPCTRVISYGIVNASLYIIFIM